MTERERFLIGETKRVLIAMHPMCQICGLAPSIQLAHVIPQTKVNLKKYGKAVIHHPLNLRAVCGLYCNARASIGTNPKAEAELVAAILADMRRELGGVEA